MSDKQEKVPKVVSPKGTFELTIVTSPSTKFKAEGEYLAKLRIPLESAGPLLKQIKAAAAQALANAKKENPKKAAKIKAGPLPYEIDEDTGTVLLKAKRKASGVSKKTGKPWKVTIPIFDSKGKPLNDKQLRIGAGSEGRISFDLREYFTDLAGAGVSLALEGVQLTKFVEYVGGASASALGFEVDEDGFSGDDLETPSEFEDETSADATDHDAEEKPGDDGDF